MAHRPSTILTRLAPTPSGYLHVGNGAGFILTWILARRASGHVLLRIDDLDRSRCRTEYIEDIFRTIDWLGIDYDIGPSGVADFEQHWSQVHRLPRYVGYLERLRELGVVYACNCSRSEVRAAAVDHRYPGTCRDKGLDLDQPGLAWRIRVPEQDRVHWTTWSQGIASAAPSQLIGDVVVRGKNQRPAYQMASLADDQHFGSTLLVRGEDLRPSTAVQWWIAQAIDGHFPEIHVHHHPLLTLPDGTKLSKSEGAIALRTWREAGRSPLPIYQQVGRWLGIDQDVTGLEDLLVG